MAKNKTVFVCNECGAETPRWAGKCNSCGAWNTLVEMIKTKTSTKNSLHMTGQNSRPVLLNEVISDNEIRFSSGIRELNRVLGGGIVPGEMVLIGGDPGIGKSTLLLQMAIQLARNGVRVLYATGEESVQQVKMRSERLNGANVEMHLVAETDVDLIISYLNQIKPQIVIIDSIQTLMTNDLGAAPGSVSQVRESAGRLLKIAKTMEMAIFLVGHVTKEGSIAGPRVLEHMVDCVLYFEGDSYNSFRILRAVKNRFGSTNEIGVFTMAESGLEEVGNPSAHLLSQRDAAAIGSVVTATIEGTRPVLVEIQSLLTETIYGTPRRMTNGVDYNRTAMIMAVLQKRAGLYLGQQDAYVNAIGGIRVTEPAADLAICLSIYSSLHNSTISRSLLAIGEVGLTGEIRAVSQIQLRVAEAEKMGFKSVIIPSNCTENLTKKYLVEIIGVKNINEALSKI